LLDLSRFLAELGKVGPYAVSRAALLRRWQVLQTDKPAYTVLNRKGLSWLATSEGLSWQPAYSTVAGVLPLDGLPRLLLREAKPLVVVQGQVEVTTAGPVGLAITPTKGVTLYVDGEPTPMAELVTRPLTKGVHTLTLMVSDPAAGATLRCEVVEVSGSSAKAVPVVGK
jgi:hypothetical protein